MPPFRPCPHRPGAMQSCAVPVDVLDNPPAMCGVAANVHCGGPPEFGAVSRGILVAARTSETIPMWWSLSAGALVMVALLARRYLRRTQRPFSAGSVSDSWLAEHKGRKDGWH